MNKIFLVALVLCFFITFSAKAEISPVKGKNTVVPPGCSATGTINCPNGFKPSCPKNYEPSCVFLGTMQMPACLANNLDNKIFSYDLNNIGCQKK